MTIAATTIATNMTQPNFYSFAAGQFNFNDVHNVPFEGSVYPDVLEVISVVNGTFLGDVFAGPNIQLNGSSSLATVVGET